MYNNAGVVVIRPKAVVLAPGTDVLILKINPRKVPMFIPSFDPRGKCGRYRSPSGVKSRGEHKTLGVKFVHMTS
jgi:hypothetical protein